MAVRNFYHPGTLITERQIVNKAELGRSVCYDEITREIEQFIPTLLIGRKMVINAYTALGGTSLNNITKADFARLFNFGRDQWNTDFFNIQ